MPQTAEKPFRRKYSLISSTLLSPATIRCFRLVSESVLHYK